MTCSESATKGIAASRSNVDGGDGRVGMRWEMAPRCLSVRIPRASPCNMFPRKRNLEAIESTMWNIVSWLRGVQKCERVYLIEKPQSDEGSPYIYPPLRLTRSVSYALIPNLIMEWIRRPDSRALVADCPGLFIHSIWPAQLFAYIR